MLPRSSFSCAGTKKRGSGSNPPGAMTAVWLLTRAKSSPAHPFKSCSKSIQTTAWSRESSGSRPVEGHVKKSRTASRLQEGGSFATHPKRNETRDGLSRFSPPVCLRRLHFSLGGCLRQGCQRRFD